MRKIRIVLLALLAAVALTTAHTHASRPHAVVPAVADVAGEGVLGRLACYACLGAAIGATATVLAPATGYFIRKCLDVCPMTL